MRSIAVAAAVAALAFSGPAAAQNRDYSSVTETARQVYSSCKTASARSGLSDAIAACACITGYMGGAMTDDDFDIAGFLLRIGELSEAGASEAAIQAEIMAFFERGYAESDVARVASLIEDMSARGDAVCGQFEGLPTV